MHIFNAGIKYVLSKFTSAFQENTNSNYTHTQKNQSNKPKPNHETHTHKSHKKKQTERKLLQEVDARRV